MSFEDTQIVVLSSATINNVSIAHIQQAIYCCLLHFNLKLDAGCGEGNERIDFLFGLM